MTDFASCAWDDLHENIGIEGRSYHILYIMWYNVGVFEEQPDAQSLWTEVLLVSHHKPVRKNNLTSCCFKQQHPASMCSSGFQSEN